MDRVYLINSVFLVFISICTSAISETVDYEVFYKNGLKLYSSQQYVDAESAFSQSTGYKARIGRAFSSFQLNELDKSVALFKQSILLANSDAERFSSLYNAAVCSFLLADYESAYLLFVDSEKYDTSDTHSLKYIKLSKYLAGLVRAQLAREKTFSKKKQSSEGKRTISAVDFVFDDDINLRVEDSESSDSINLNQLQLYLSDKAFIKSLVDAGIASIKINNNSQGEKIYSAIDKKVIYEFSNLEKVTITPSSSTTDLWKRIFEIEQGYPASLDEAEVIPGVRTW